MGPKKQVKNVVEEVAKEAEIPIPEHQLTGYGRFQYLNGNIYEGNWRIVKNEKVKHGYGKLLLSNFVQQNRSEQAYEGNWVNDSMEGFGIYSYVNGDTYTGEWKENKHSGLGKMQFANGTSYDGQWKDHNMHGTGLFKDHLGRTWQGQFRNGIFQSRMQIELSKEKTQYKRKSQIKIQIVQTIAEMIKILQQQSDQSIKSKIVPFFGDRNALKDLIKENLVRYEQKGKQQWLSALKEAHDGTYHILQRRSDGKSVRQQRLIGQKQGKGQLVEISLKSNPQKWIFFVNIEKKRWILGGITSKTNS